MFNRIKLWYYNHKSFIYNTQYILYSIVLLILVIIVDNNYYEFKNYLPDFFFTKVTMAKTILASLAGAQLTITTFTFSVILSVVATYISNFSPRVIENFFSEKIIMKVLGIFFGGFFYSISALLLMRNFSDDTMVIAGFVAVVYSVLSMIYFIIFVQKVLYSSNVQNLINNIYSKTLSALFTEIDGREEHNHYIFEDNSTSINIYPKQNGFLSLIDYKNIALLLEGCNTKLIIDCKIGDYINVEKPLAHINEELDETVIEKISAYFFINNNKIYENDYRHGFEKLEDIAIRAMSGGMKYPNTAIRCINKIILLLTHLSKLDSYHLVVKGSLNNRIYYTSYTFEEDLVNSLSNIINYGHDDMELMYAILEGLDTLYYSSTMKNKRTVINFATDLYENILDEVKGEYNKKKIEKIYMKIKKKQ